MKWVERVDYLLWRGSPARLGAPPKDTINGILPGFQGLETRELGLEIGTGTSAGDDGKSADSLLSRE